MSEKIGIVYNEVQRHQYLYLKDGCWKWNLILFFRKNRMSYLYTITDSENNKIEINNKIYKSQFLIDTNQDHVIPLSKIIKGYYFDRKLELTDFELVDYIISCLMFICLMELESTFPEN